MNPTVKFQVVFAGIVMGLLCSSGVVRSNFTNGGYSSPDMQEAACGRSAVQLLPCLPAVQGSGSKPSSSCCTVLNDWGFGCLCDLLGDNRSRIPGNINKTRILELPKSCGVPVPADAKCGGLVPEPPADIFTIPKGGKLAEQLEPGHE